MTNARPWERMEPPRYIAQRDPWEPCSTYELLTSCWRDAIGVHRREGAAPTTHARPWRWLMHVGTSQSLIVTNDALELKASRDAVPDHVFAGYLAGAELGIYTIADIRAQLRRRSWEPAAVEAQDLAHPTFSLGLVLYRLGVSLDAVHVRPLGWEAP